MSQNLATKNRTNPSSDDAWWRLGSSTWLLVGGLLLFNVGCFLQPALLDTVFGGLFNLFDFRTWPWWYFLCLIAVLAFSVRWFILYVKMVDDEFDPQSLEEARWFCLLTGSLTGLFAVLLVLHRTGLMRRMHGTLNYMFGFGAFSIWALLIFFGILAVIGMIVALAWKWVSSFEAD